MAMLDAEAIQARARSLRLLLFDVDGVLTDGSVLIGSDGWEAKPFSIRDGAALVIHAQADDYKTDPSGNSGDRIACAVLSPGGAAPTP